MKKILLLKQFLGSICMILSFIMASMTAGAADRYVATTGSNSNDGLTPLTAWMTVQHTVVNSDPGDVIHIAAGTYVEVGQILINKNLSIIGADKTTTIIKPAQNTTASGDSRGWWLIEAGSNFDLSDVTLDGAGWLIYMGVYYWGNGTVDNCIIKNIKYNESGPEYNGRGMIIKGNVNVTNCEFSEFGRIGIQYFGGGGTADGNTITGKGAGNWLDYGIETGNGALTTITNNYITNCAGIALSDGSTSAAVLITTFFGPGTTSTVDNNILTGNSNGIWVGQNASDASSVTAHYNDLSSNSTYSILTKAAAVNATCNWYGTIISASIALKISGLVDYTPYLTNGTDNAPGTSGFQPVPNSCNGYQYVDCSKKNDKKVIVCHNGKSQCISVNALQAHLNHGDLLGPCSSANRGGITDITDFTEEFKISVAPNPVTAGTTIRYELPVDSRVNITLYDPIGRMVAVLVNAPRNAGTYNYLLDASKLAAGIYYYKMIAVSEDQKFEQGQKLMIIK